jgi:hypothetical protein
VSGNLENTERKEIEREQPELPLPSASNALAISQAVPAAVRSETQPSDAPLRMEPKSIEPVADAAPASPLQASASTRRGTDKTNASETMRPSTTTSKGASWWRW